MGMLGNIRRMCLRDKLSCCINENLPKWCQISRNVYIFTAEYQKNNQIMTNETTTSLHRTSRNLLVSGHGNARLPSDETTRAKIFTSLERAIKAFGTIVDGENGNLRILTGLSDGTDAQAAALAKSHGIEVHVIAPCRPGGIAATGIEPDRLALITGAIIETPPDALIAAADEAKLSLADALIVVWDGEPSQGPCAGLVRLIIEASRRYTPVVWIDARTASAGTILGLDPSRLDAATLAMLAADDSHLGRLRSLFKVFEVPLESDIRRLVDVFWNVKSLAPLYHTLDQEEIEPGQRPTLDGWWHTSFFGLFGPWKRKKNEAVRAWRGPQEYVSASQLPETTWYWFDRLDRAATHCANKHRDNVVLIHGFSVLAVLAAVAGAISAGAIPDAAWGIMEFAALFGIGMLVWLNLRQRRRILTSHDAWLHFRQAAEALRMGAMLHPFLATLPALHRDVWIRSKNEPELAKPYNWLVIQLLREAGTPGQDNEQGLEPRLPQLLGGLRALINDQIGYHSGAHDRYHRTHHRLHLLTLSVFGIVVITVLGHLSALAIVALEHNGTHLPEFLAEFGHWTHEQRWLLIITAVFPALAAGLHGISSKIELQRLAKSSSRMKERLEVLGQAVDRIQPDDRPMTLRAIALETTVTMYAEHDAWADLMADQGLEIPA